MANAAVGLPLASLDRHCMSSDSAPRLRQGSLQVAAVSPRVAQLELLI